MPGAVPRTSTFALTNATLPYAVKIANKGFFDAIRGDDGLKAGVNTYAGTPVLMLWLKSPARRLVNRSPLK
jgi:alanine dehydrogenase